MNVHLFLGLSAWLRTVLAYCMLIPTCTLALTSLYTGLLVSATDLARAAVFLHKKVQNICIYRIYVNETITFICKELLNKPCPEACLC
jgi:hypothetical protein